MNESTSPAWPTPRAVQERTNPLFAHHPWRRWKLADNAQVAVHLVNALRSIKHQPAMSSLLDRNHLSNFLHIHRLRDLIHNKLCQSPISCGLQNFLWWWRCSELPHTGGASATRSYWALKMQPTWLRNRILFLMFYFEIHSDIQQSYR